MANTKPIIYVIDDEPEICRSLTMLLHAEGYYTQTFPSGDIFVHSLSVLPPGVIVTDVRMPGMTGIALLGVMRDVGRPDPVIVITGHGDVPLAVEALKLGAADFIEKPYPADVILSAIRACVASDWSEAQRSLTSLTKRELEVFGCLVDGATNKRIAIELGISPRTVEIYRGHVMEKMRAGSLSQLVRMGVEAGLARASVHDGRRRSIGSSI